MNYSKLFTQRKDGLYCATYRVDGKKKYLYDRDPKKLFDKMEAIKAGLGEKPKFGKEMDLWLEDHSGSVGYKTIESYAAPMERIREEFGGDALDEITPQRVKSFLEHLGRRGYSRRTVQLHRDIMSMVYSFAILRQDVQSSPVAVVGVPKGLPSTRRDIPSEEALNAVRERTDAFFAPFALLCLYCGLRRGEVLPLTQGDIDRKNHVVRITKAVTFGVNSPELKSPKTESGVREVFIPDALMPHIPKRKGLLFPGADGKLLTKSAFRKHWLRYCREIGYDITPHQLRHAYATFLYEAGVPVLSAQKRLGHANATTTMGVYTHLREMEDRKSDDILNAYFNR